MNRRSVLRGLGLGAVVSTAGCLDLTTTSTDGVSPTSARHSVTESGTGATSTDQATNEAMPAVTGGLFQYTAANTGYHPSSTGPKQATRTRWTFEPDEFGEELTSPAVHDGRLFVGSERGTLYAVDVTDGHRLWTYQSDKPLNDPPAVAGGLVYVGSEDNTLTALHAEDGNEAWTFTARSDITSPPTVVDGTVYVGSADHHLYALAADTGDRIWQQKVDTGIQSVPAVADGTIVFPSGLRIYALSTSTGQVQWETYINTRSRGATIHDGIAYVPTGNGGHDQYVFTFDISTGNQRWQADLDGNGNRGVPATNGSLLYVSTREGHLYAFNLDSGEREWTVTLDDRTNSSPLLVDQVVYLTTFSGFYGFDAHDGRERFHIETVEAFTQTPVVLDGTAFIADNGSVTALED